MELGVLAITESSLTGNVSDQRIVAEVTATGYWFDHAAQIMFKKTLSESELFFVILWNVKTIFIFQITSWRLYLSEYVFVYLLSIYYRQLWNLAWKLHLFFRKYSDYLTICLPTVVLRTLDDFKIHLDCQRKADGKHLVDILRSANLGQNVQQKA